MISTCTSRTTSSTSIRKLHSTQCEHFASLATRPLSYRITQLHILKKLILENEDALTDALTADLGKTSIEGQITEIAMCLGEIEIALSNLTIGEKWGVELPVASSGVLMPAFASIRPEPRGVTLVIGPFNYPIISLLGPLVSSLAAGNTCILKPSELCPKSEQILSDLVNKYFDKTIVAVIRGATPETTTLMELEWGLVFFTGCERVAKIIGVAAAKTLSPMVMELGGKSPCVITENHPEMKAMCNRIMWGKTINAGQTCVAPDYLLVQENIVDPVIAGLKAALLSMYGLDIKSSSFSRNVSEFHTDRLLSLIDDAKKCGGEILTGGTEESKVKEKYFPPTLIRMGDAEGSKGGKTSKAKILQEEIFGCILPIVTYKTDQDAIDYINVMRGTPLAMYVFTRSDNIFQLFLHACPSGSAVMNDVVVQYAVLSLPFGGCGTSGYGKGHGKDGFAAFSHFRGTLRKPCKAIFEFGGLRYAPYDKYFGMSGSMFRFLIENLPPIPVKPVSLLVMKGTKVVLIFMALKAGYNAVGGVSGVHQVCASGDGKEITNMVKRVVFEGVGRTLMKIGKLLQEL